MKRSFPLITVVLISIMFNACAQKVNMRALEPAEVDRVSSTKKITVSNFRNDRVGLSRKIEANLARFRIDNKKYFTLVSRNDFDKIIKEQKAQNSGLISQETVVEIGNLIGAQAIISGNVASPTSSDVYFYEKRSKCADKECKTIRKYKVRCQKRTISLSAEIRIVDVKRGDIIFADTLSESENYKHCSDDSRSIPSTSMAAQKMSVSLANKFTYKLTPHYRSFRVTLLEDPDLDYNDAQEDLLKVSLEYIKKRRYDKAENLLMKLINSTASQSYVPFYNIGVIKEAQGNYKEAEEYYANADNLMVKPVDEINNAVVRIDNLIAKRNQTLEQIGR